MPSKFFSDYVCPAAVLAGSIMGVGFLSLPYVAAKAGIWLTLFYFCILAFIAVVLHLVFVQISLKTPDFKRFPGFAGYYLGKNGKIVALLASVIGYFGVLLAYLIVGGEFLTEALSPFFGGDNLTYTLLYFLAGSIIIFFGIKIISRIELASIAFLLLAIIFIAVKGFWKIEFQNIFALNPGMELKDYFLPYGPILFSLWGVGLIPEVEEMMSGNKKSVAKVVIVGTLIPAVIYILFVLLILGITGLNTTQSALVGLSNFLGDGITLVSVLMGAMVTFVAFLVHGMTFKKILVYDLKIKNWQAMVIACCTPLILYLLGMKSLITLVSFIGGVLLGIDGILILLMYKKIGGRKIIIYPLGAIFLLGIIYEIVNFTNIM